MISNPVPELSIVVPAYNEEGRIRPTLDEYVEHFRGLYGDGFEVIVVLNGCRDGTRSVVEAVMRQSPQVRLIEFAEPLGKGGAIWEGFAVARAQRLAFADADNMVRAPETAKVIRALETHDIAIADRFRDGHRDTGQGMARRTVSVGARLWVRGFLGLPYSDTQCGAKAFRTAAWRTLAPLVRERGWAFDLDVLAQARRLGFSVAEVPVEWRHVAEGSKVNPWTDAPKTFAATFGIRRRTR